MITFEKRNKLININYGAGDVNRFKSLNNIDKHRELSFFTEVSSGMVHQLNSKKYKIFDEYINNVNIIRFNLACVSEILHDENNNFENYLFDNDPALYYNAQSLLLAVRMFENMLDSLTESLSNAADN